MSFLISDLIKFSSSNTLLAQLHITSMKKSQSNLLNGALIVLGGLLLLCTIFVEDWLLIFQIPGIIMLMLGAYRSSIYRSEIIENNRDEEE